MIIDAHVHLSTFTNEGLSFNAIRERLVTEMNARGVEYSLVLPDSEPGSAVADLDATMYAVVSEPRLFPVGTVHVPGLTPENVEQLETLAATNAIYGLKLYPGFEEFYPADPECRPLYELCIRHGIPVIFHTGETLYETWREEYNHPREIAELARRLPELNIVIAHFSQPHLEVCRDVVLAFPRVHADISSLAYPTVEQVCGKTLIRQILEETARKQPEKLLFGTDWPVCDVGRHIDLVNSLDVPEETREMIFSGNARRLFGLP